jgi:hypothetical protein
LQQMGLTFYMLSRLSGGPNFGYYFYEAAPLNGNETALPPPELAFSDPTAYLYILKCFHYGQEFNFGNAIFLLSFR